MTRFCVGATRIRTPWSRAPCSSSPRSRRCSRHSVARAALGCGAPRRCRDVLAAAGAAHATRSRRRRSRRSPSCSSPRSVDRRRPTCIAMYFPLLDPRLLRRRLRAAARRPPGSRAADRRRGRRSTGVIDRAASANVVFPMAVVTLCWLGGRNVRARTRLAAELHEAAAPAAEEREARAARGGRRRAPPDRARDARRRRAQHQHHGRAGRRRPPASCRSTPAAPRRRRRGSAAPAPTRSPRCSIAAERARGRAVARRAVARRPARRSSSARVTPGSPVTLGSVGTPRPLPAGAELAAYRIVQEALTNAIKHAGGAPTGVQLDWGERALELRVADRGDGCPPRGPRGRRPRARRDAPSACARTAASCAPAAATTAASRSSRASRSRARSPS